MALRLTAARIGALIAELEPLLQGKRVSAVDALPPRDLLIVVEDPERDPDGTRFERVPVLRLRLSANPEACRVHLQHGRVHSHKGGTGPFYRRLAQDLSGARLTAISQPSADRLVHLSFRGGEHGDRGLLAELTGRHANLVLLDGQDRVLELLVPPPAGKGATRAPRLQIGQPWVPPPGHPKPSSAAETPVERAPEATPPPGLSGKAPLSWAVECELGGQAEEHDRDRKRRSLRERLDRKRKRARSNLAGLERRAEAASGAERVRADGELLKASLGQVKRGQRQLEVVDYYAGTFESEEGASGSDAEPSETPQRTLELDPKLSPADNVERYFARARKLERAAANLPDELERAAERLQSLEELLERVRDPESDPEELEREALQRRLVDPPQEPDARRRTAPVARLPYRTFTSGEGREIRVGRSAKDNDALSLKLSRGNDLWLHTADTPGSHVVLRVERGQEPGEEDILDAAHLAVQFSPLAGAARADVHVARCKEIRKPKGAPPGLVHLSGGRTLSLRMEESRLRRLLDRRPQDPRAPGAPSKS